MARVRPAAALPALASFPKQTGWEELVGGPESESRVQAEPLQRPQSTRLSAPISEVGLRAGRRRQVSPTRTPGSLSACSPRGNAGSWRPRREAPARPARGGDRADRAIPSWAWTSVESPGLHTHLPLRLLPGGDSTLCPGGRVRPRKAPRGNRQRAAEPRASQRQGAPRSAGLGDWAPRRPLKEFAF